jgi:hypothetical protein
MSKDGDSAATFIKNAKNMSTTLLVVKDNQGTIFGALCFEHWRNSMHFFGTGETQLFTFKEDDQIKVY